KELHLIVSPLIVGSDLVHHLVDPVPHRDTTVVDEPIMKNLSLCPDRKPKHVNAGLRHDLARLRHRTVYVLDRVLYDQGVMDRSKDSDSPLSRPAANEPE